MPFVSLTERRRKKGKPSYCSEKHKEDASPLLLSLSFPFFSVFCCMDGRLFSSSPFFLFSHPGRVGRSERISSSDPQKGREKSVWWCRPQKRKEGSEEKASVSHKRRGRRPLTLASQSQPNAATTAISRRKKETMVVVTEEGSER